MAKKDNIKNMTDKDLVTLVTEKREALRQVRFATSSSRGRDVKKLRESKKEIARALTELSARTK
ncbi:MAG: hypothetical protein AMXMBFR44_2010 [Candidatus Campbellbacteria bacterium]